MPLKHLLFLFSWEPTLLLQGGRGWPILAQLRVTEWPGLSNAEFESWEAHVPDNISHIL